MLSGIVKNSNVPYILDEIKGMVAGWKMNLLRRSRSLALAQSVVIVMFTYTM